MNPQDIPGQMTVDDCIAEASVDEILYLALTQHDPATMCASPTFGCSRGRVARSLAGVSGCMTMSSALDAALQQIEKDFGKGSILTLGDPSAFVPVEAIPTGAQTLNAALGVGGLPRGRIVEIYGPESSGKTTLVLSVLARAQHMGLKVAFIDAEHALDPSYAEALGCDLDSMLFSQPDSGEQALEIADRLIRSAGVGVVAIDSVAALTPQAELDGEMGQQFMGLQARMMGQAMRKIAGWANRTQTLVVFVNQIREKVGVTFGSPETTPGGRALRFYASCRLDIRRIGSVKQGDEVVANQVRVKVVKNKVAPPFKTAEFEIRFGEGIDQAGPQLDEMIATALSSSPARGLPSSTPAMRVQGREAARQLVKDGLR